MSNQPNSLGVLTTLDLREIELACARAITSCGVGNGHPITVTERQAIAIRTVIDVGGKAVNALYRDDLSDDARTKAGTQLSDVLEQLKKEFVL